MKQLILIILFGIFGPLLAHAQTAARYELSGSGAPTGNCTVTGSGYSQIYVDRTTGKRWACVGALGVTNGTWIEAAAAAGAAPNSATYITQTANASLSAEQALGALATGILKSTTTTGVITIAGATDLNGPISCADAGASDAYACNLSPAITGYATGAHYRFKANTANTGAATIALNGLSAITIVKVAGGITTALADNDIRAGQWVDIVYDGTNFQIQSTLGNAPGGAAFSILAAGSSGGYQLSGPGTTLFAAFSDVNVSNSPFNTEETRQTLMPTSGTLRNLTIRTTSAQPGDFPLIFTIRINGVDTSIVVTVPAGAAAGTFTDTTHTASFVTGDLLSLKAFTDTDASAIVKQWAIIAQ